jgi:hypothetical protein
VVSATDPYGRALGFLDRISAEKIFWEVEDLERGPLSLVSTIELLERKSSGSGLESRIWVSDFFSIIFPSKSLC